MRGIARDERSPVQRIALVDRSIVDAWNDTELAVPAATAVELFEARVDRHPNQPAVILGDRQITYGDLDARANAVANALRERGIGREMIVGIALKRSIETSSVPSRMARWVVYPVVS